MGRPRKNPAENTDNLIEGQDGEDFDLEEGEADPAQDEQGNDPSENTDSAKAGGDGKKEAKAKPFTGKVKNPALANRTVFGVTGVPIVFDGDGVAECDEAEGNHFLSVPGFKAV